MIFSEPENYYELLEVEPDASPEEIEKAYFRLKNAFSTKSHAVYSLLSQEETEDYLRKIEEAYRGLLNYSNGQFKEAIEDQNNKKFIEGLAGEEELTAFSWEEEQEIWESPADQSETPEPAVLQTIEPSPSRSQELLPEDLSLKEMREFRNFSIQDLSQSSKISPKYLKALEEENFSSLPAPVFVRGFIIQIAQALKVPSESLLETVFAKYKKFLDSK